MKISALAVYPIKSCGGVWLSSSRITARGLWLDRHWVIVDEQGTFLSQRTEPTLAQVTVAIEHDHLRVTAPSAGQPVRLALEQALQHSRQVTIWDDTCEGAVEHAEVNEWFQELLGRRCELVRCSDTTHRQVDPRYARSGDEVGFADGFPFLLTCEASLAELNHRLPSPIPMDRFRPNIVVSGSTPFEEDSWRSISLGDVVFRVAKPCSRCVVVNVDQRTGERGTEPLNTLATFRRRDNKILFGQNLVHGGRGVLRVGDHAVVIDRR